MRIIIVGATIVGTDLAEYLVQAGHAVTLIDNPSEELAQIANRLDLRVVQGDPTWPSVLREAGARNTELLVATSPNDEVNIAVCSVASALFNIPRKIARMRAPDFLSEADKLFGEQAIPIDHVISPEHLMADAVVELMNFPGAIAVNNFANDRLTVAGVTCSAGGKLIGAQILDLENYDGKCKVLAVFRNGKPLTKFENQTLILGDDVFFCAERLRALNLLSALIPLRPNGKNVVIQGGSHIADAIALRLSQRYKVKLIEPDAKRAARISDRFRNSAVELYCADASNMDFVIEEKLFQTDTFIAASPQEESNIMASLMVQKAYPGDCTVTVCHSRSKNLKEMCLQADIIIVALGVPEFLKADMVKEGAVIVDVGTTRVPDPTRKSGFRLCGDVKFDEVAPKCSYISPVPGGVGPMTIISLMRNTLLAGKKEIYK